LPQICVTAGNLELFNTEQVQEFARAAVELDRAKRAAPAGALVAKFDKGPWRYIQEKNTATTYKDIVESGDFTHDVRLYVNGDFASLEQRTDYCKGLAAALNSTATGSAAAPADTAKQAVLFALGLAENENDDAAVSFLMAWNSEDTGYLQSNWSDFIAANQPTPTGNGDTKNTDKGEGNA